MAVVSLLLGIFSFLLAAAGVVFSVVPYVGVIASVLSLVSAVAGIITGARAHSRAREDGGDTTFPVIGLVINCIMFLMALCVTATCGACNTLITNSNRDGRFLFGPDGAMLDPSAYDLDGGVVDPFAPAVAPTPDPNAVPVAPPPAAAPVDPGAVAPDPAGAGGAPPAAPPPAFPPPPMNAPGR